MWCFEKFSLDFMRLYLFVLTLNWVILDSLENLRDLELIYIMVEVMEGHGMTPKFIFLTLIMLSLLQNVPRAIR